MSDASPPINSNDGGGVRRLTSSVHNPYVVSTSNASPRPGNASPRPDGNGVGRPPSSAVHNPYSVREQSQSVWSFFQPETVDADAPPTPNTTSPSKRRRLFQFRSPSASRGEPNNDLVPVIPPPPANELVSAFPPCDGEDYSALDDSALNEGDATSSSTLLPNSSTITPPTPTLFSTYDYAARRDIFPIPIPERVKQIIISTIIAISSIGSPRPFQVFAIYCMVFLCSQVVYLIRKTGEGKSLVIITTAALLRGVTIVMVPLIGLGSDQVNKAVNLGQRIEAYHVDENVGKDFLCLMKRLLSIKTRGGHSGSSIILYCSPQSLSPTTNLSRCLKQLARLNLITAVFVDEAHTIHREGYHGSKFRTEFDSGFSNLVDIMNLQSKQPNGKYPNLGIMSATLRKEYQATLEKISKKKPTIVCWGEMSRRNIAFIVHILGQPSSGIRRLLSAAYKEHRSRKVLLYSNSKTNAETTLTSVAESVLDEHNIIGDVIALTGDCGIMMKT